MSFFALSTLILINIIDVMSFINVIIIIRVFNTIIIIDFFIENTVLNINVLNFSAYSTR